MNFREFFPQLQTSNITYLDSAATTLKLKSVVDSLSTYYLEECANIHRGIHHLSEINTDKYEATRDAIKDFIKAKKREEIIFTKGTTESINLVARTYGETFLKDGDEIVISELEHHSNIVPWQLLQKKINIVIKVIPVNLKGEILLDEASKLITNKTKLVSISMISNTLGSINPVSKIIELAHAKGAVVLLDAAQAASHLDIDVQKLDCDFLAFSAHKMFGPTGVGILYGKEELLDKMPPFIGGGDMIDSVSFEETTYNKLPYKFEAGTPHIAGVIAFKEAIDFIKRIGIENIKKQEDELLEYATKKLKTLKGFTLVGEAENKSSIISFNIKGVHSHDIGSFTSEDNIALRTGHHCTQPLLKKLNVGTTARASLSLYNTKEDVDKLYNSLNKMIDIFGL